mgnify:CR=1 FL=1|jgi:ribosome-interacting GTPase 1|tara:strand:- start:5706 stop:5954 length:249 start_codon:yes stop_codon:yes gene_type:complete
MEKIKEESIEKIKSIQTEMNKIQQELGAISLLEARKAMLVASHVEFEEKMAEERKLILEEHGDGTVNLDTGEFTPVEAEEVK